MNSELIDTFFEQYWEEAAPARELMAYYRCAIMEIETKLHVLNEEFSLKQEFNPIESISTRLKSPESIYNKMKRYELPFTPDAIESSLNDVAGIRVICSFVDDIYLIRDCLASQDDLEIEIEKDYIKQPKANGYRSLHLVISVPIYLQTGKKPMKVEVQLRTIAMDSWASLDHKLRYKQNLSESIRQAIADELQTCSRLSAELDLRMMNTKQLVEHQS